MQIRKATQTDIPGILDLQAANLFSNLNIEEHEKGFVTTPFTIELIEEIILQKGLFIALDNKKIVSYVFAGSWEYFLYWDIFKYMITRFPDLEFQGKSITIENSFQYGPICIDVNYRGRGLINQIFEEMRLHLKEKYPISLTFINAENIPSTKAHTEKLGWKIIDRFEFNGGKYLGLAFDMSRSVL
jgi:hypothetical protein